MIQNLQNYDSHPIFQEIVKYNFKMNVTPKTLKIYTCSKKYLFSNLKKRPILPLAFMDCAFFLNNLLENLVKNLD